MRVLFVSSEVYPFAKTGGLGDVSAALPRALSALGIDVRVLMPAYPQALARAASLKEIERFGTVLGFGGARLLECFLPQSQVPLWLADCPELYNRVGGPYQDALGVEWPDNAQRFALLNHVAAGIANEAGGRWKPDIVHANDWHVGLLPLLRSGRTGRSTPLLLTIHNLAYQGLFDWDCFDRLEVPPHSFPSMEFWGKISFLKAGIIGADAITTVSPTYAAEILTPEYGCGLDGVLREKAAVITGILNGADYGLWDPAADPYIRRNYTARSVARKAECKSAIQRELGLSEDFEAPLLAYMSRLVHQKMPDVLLEVLPSLIESGMQFALVAEGDTAYQDEFCRLAARYPAQVGVRIGYDETMAHRLVAGADMLMHPSRFEPCGLVPIYGLRYGTIPIVRNSGGMADTVVDATSEALRAGTATGFSFEGLSADELVTCVHRAAALYRQPISWRKLQQTAMSQDFGWGKSAERYTELYRALTTGQIPAAPASAEPRYA
jgi:starch synthase